MSNWENFEIDCTKYLNENFGMYAKFIHMGGADSTTSDIFVEGKNFYIDAKKCPAQCGQFVLLPNIETQNFIYSRRNFLPSNESAEKIIAYMNKFFEDYRNAGTAGKIINLPEEIFADWIINFYRCKNVRLIITNNFVIFPVEKMLQHFEIYATYRVKRSGSNKVGKNKIELVSNFLSDSNSIENIFSHGGKIFVSSPENLNNKKFILNDTEYMFSRRENIFEVRKLSNTYNANVIFSIKNKNSAGMSAEKFITFLR